MMQLVAGTGNPFRSACLVVATTMVLVLTTAGCEAWHEFWTDPIDDFCCLSQTSCQEGGASEVTVCEDADRPYCTDGPGPSEFGPGYTCIPDPSAIPCGSPEDCTPDRPFCIDEVCRQCESSLDCPASSPVCAESTYMCLPCQFDEQCAGWTDPPRCLVETGACVECTASPDCGPEAPVCQDNACRTCLAHSECGSEVCDFETGACVDEGDVIYLAPTGGPGGCTRGSPCNTFALGLGQVTGSRNVIKAASGMYTGPITIDGLTLRIFADGATVRPGTQDTNAVAIINGADVMVDGLTVTGATGTTNPVGISCTALTSTLRLRRSTVINNSSGVRITSCQFSLVNNVIAVNGSLTSAFGGVKIEDITTGGMHEFEFNTVTANGGAQNTSTGVRCDSTVPISLSNSIVYGNVVSGASGAQVGGDSNCAWTFSDIQQTVAGTGNINAEPLFVDPGSDDYHIEPNSPAKNAADPDATVSSDIDNEARPQGGRADMGADEAP